jgi:hypothetical protein
MQAEEEPIKTVFNDSLLSRNDWHNIRSLANHGTKFTILWYYDYKPLENPWGFLDSTDSASISSNKDKELCEFS